MPAETRPEPVNPHYDVSLPQYSRWRRMQIPVFAGAAITALHAIGPTLRFESVGHHHYLQGRAREGAVICVFWHRCIISSTWFWRNQGAVVLNTTNFDGQWTRRVIEHFGFNTAQGSSTRGGLRGLAVMARRLEEGLDSGFSIDGPRGPRYIAKPGPVMLARRSGKPIYPFHVAVERAYTIKKAWDLMQIPYPFSRAVLVGGPLIHVSPAANAEEIERKQAEMQQGLERVRDIGDAWFKVSGPERERLRAECNEGA